MGIENSENKRKELDSVSREMNEMFINEAMIKEVQDIHRLIELVGKYMARGIISEKTPLGEAMKKLVDVADELVGEEERADFNRRDIEGKD